MSQHFKCSGLGPRPCPGAPPILRDGSRIIQASNAATAQQVNHSSARLHCRKPSEFDIVCGRGKGTYNLPGNVRFRALVNGHVHEYLAAKSRIDKSIVLNTIMEKARSQNDGRAYFLKQDADGAWRELEEEQAREKVGHAMREIINALERLPEQEQARAAFQAKHEVLFALQQEIFQQLLQKHASSSNKKSKFAQSKQLAASSR